MSTNAPRLSLGGQIVGTASGILAFQGFSFLAALLVARGLGPIGQGRFQLFVSICVFGAMLAKAGLDEGLAYKLPRYRETAPEKVTGLIVYALGFSLLSGLAIGLVLQASAGALAYRWLDLPGLAVDLRWAPVCMPILTVMLMSLAALRGLGRSDLRAWSYYYGVGLGFLAAVASLWLAGMTLDGVLTARVGSYAFGALLAVVGIACCTRLGSWRLTLTDVTALHGFASWLVLVSLLQYLLEQPLIDLLIVGAHRGAEQVGIYSVAARLGRLLAFLPAAFTIVLAPALAQARARNDEQGLVERYVRGSTALAHLSVLAAGTLILSRTTLLGWFGEAYVEGDGLLVVLALGCTLTGIAGLNGPLLLATDRTRVEFGLTYLTVIAMVGGGLLLVGPLGAMGVALATAASIGMLAFLRLAYCVRQVVRVRPSWIADSVGFGVLAGSSGWLVSRGLGAGAAGDVLGVLTFLTVYVVGISAVRGRSHLWRLVRGTWS